ncbi:MAG: hypothetical protein KF874_05305 [Rhizobiaceae bacterium]|nr:hypothetical protein [Rhizobiaceae bacterium]
MLRITSSRMKPAFASLGLLLALAGCQSNEGQTGQTMSTGDMAGSKPKVSQTELEAFCPPVRLRQGTAALNRYARGGEGDHSKLAFQASIGETTRVCTRAAGTMTIEVAAAGRVIPGPAGAPTSVSLPIRVAVTRGDEVLYSDLKLQEVAITEKQGATQFLFKNPSISIPIPAERNVIVQLGFDDAAR